MQSLRASLSRRSLQRSPRLLALLFATACAGDQVQYAPSAAPMPGGQATAVVYLVGDGGEVNPAREAVLEHLRGDIEAAARDGAGPPIVVVFLGDNVYDDGAQADAGADDLEKLAGQALAIPPLPNVRGIFVPGNHDWANGASHASGREAVARQRAWMADMAEGRHLRLLPEDGCPGPASEDVGSARLLFIDTEWLLRSPRGPCGTAEAFYERLAEALRAASSRPVLLLSHHPVASGGPHGGNVGIFERGPLLYYLAVKSGSLRQDLSSPAYTAMRRGLAGAIEASGAPPLIHAAGHDHTLQIIRLAGPDQPRYQLVSGALSRTENARRVDGTRWASNGYGFMRLELVGSEIRVAVFRRDVEGGPVRSVFGCTLTHDAPADECPEAPLADGP